MRGLREDLSTSITDGGPIDGEEYYASVVSALTRADGICESESMPPPWSHISECNELVPCRPRVTITIEIVVSNWCYAVLRVEDGAVCGVPINYFDTVDGWTDPLLVAPLIDQQVPVACGNLDCPIDIPVDFTFDIDNVVDALFYVERWSLNIGGSLACTACDAVTQPPF